MVDMVFLVFIGFFVSTTGLESVALRPDFLKRSPNYFPSVAVVYAFFFSQLGNFAKQDMLSMAEYGDCCH